MSTRAIPQQIPHIGNTSIQKLRGKGIIKLRGRKRREEDERGSGGRGGHMRRRAKGRGGGRWERGEVKGGRQDGRQRGGEGERSYVEIIIYRWEASSPHACVCVICVMCRNMRICPNEIL